MLPLNYLLTRVKFSIYNNIYISYFVEETDILTLTLFKLQYCRKIYIKVKVAEMNNLIQFPKISGVNISHRFKLIPIHIN